MPQLVYAREEILREHPYAAPHEVAGYRLHGGFDAAGTYLSPRTAVRPAAVRAWQEALAARGFPLLPADASLLAAGPYPTEAQTALLLRHGLGQGLWNGLTIAGVIEARGRLLADVTAPDFAPLVEEDVSRLAVGHLNRGLLLAHGLDEGGDPPRGVGGHDAMWFAIRDLVFAKDRYPRPEIPPRIARPNEDERLAPDLPAAHEQFVLLLMNVLMIEVRAETTFAFTERVLRDAGSFADRRAGADLGVALVRRIRQDEVIHVEYLRTVLSELRSLTFCTRDGGRRPGAELIDPIWAILVHWHAVENPRRARIQSRELSRERILAHPEGPALWREFLALEPPDPFADAA